MRGKKRLEKDGRHEMEEEEHSFSISVMGYLESEISPSKPKEQPTQNDTKLTSNERICESEWENYHPQN